MKHNSFKLLTGFILYLSILFSTAIFATEPLSLWKNSKIKNKIVEFVNHVQTNTDPLYLPTPNRIAVFSQFNGNNQSNLAINELITFLKQADFTIYLIKGINSDSLQILTTQSNNDSDMDSKLPTHSNDSEQLVKPMDENNPSSPDPIQLNSNKPIPSTRIDEVIGAQPILALGNEDKDLSLLNFTSTNTPNLILVIKNNTNGKLISDAEKNGWIVINPSVDF